MMGSIYSGQAVVGGEQGTEVDHIGSMWPSKATYIMAEKRKGKRKKRLESHTPVPGLLTPMT